MIIVLLGLAFMYLPLLLVMALSFHFNDPFLYYRQFLTNSTIINGLISSVELAFFSTIISLFFSVVIVLSMNNERSVWSSILFSQFILSDLVVSVSLLGVFTAIGIAISIKTLILSYILVGISCSSALILQSLQADKDHRSFIDAARDLGASYMSIVQNITLPRLYNIITSAGLWNITHILEDVIFISFLAGPAASTFPTVMLARMREGVDFQLNALSTCIIVIFLLVSILTINRQNIQ